MYFLRNIDNSHLAKVLGKPDHGLGPFVTGDPQATQWCSTEQLKSSGVSGLYTTNPNRDIHATLSTSPGRNINSAATAQTVCGIPNDGTHLWLIIQPNESLESIKTKATAFEVAPSNGQALVLCKACETIIAKTGFAPSS